MRLSHLTVASLLALTASRASAQLPFTPQVYCGAPHQNCFAAGFLWNPNGALSVSIFVQSLDGTVSHAHHGGLKVLYFDWMHSVRAGDPDYEGPNLLVGAPRSAWPVGNIVTGPVPADGFNISDESQLDPGFLSPYRFELPKEGVVGCTRTTPNNQPGLDFFVSTCPRAGLDGWLRMDFPIALPDGMGGVGPVSPNDVSIRLFDVCYVTPSDGRLTGSNNCYVYDYKLDVLPEPSTFVLLAPALLGVIGLVRRRARVS